MVKLSKAQKALVQRKINGRTFLEGPAGAGKTTVGVRRMLHLLEKGVSSGSLLVLVPQRTLALPYYDALRQPDLVAGGQVTVLTLGGLARRMVDLFWPLIAAEAGFGRPDQRPTFLSLEGAQYFMAQIVAPLIETEGYFETVTIDRSRTYSQLVDNLNKAAVVGFPYSEIGERLKDAWIGDDSQRRMYDEVQDCINRFRAYCLQHNLLDFSLQAEVFTRHLWPLPECRRYLFGQFRHLIVDNIEEDNPATHRILRDWLPECESALVICDTEAGYRSFLGADPQSALALIAACDKHESLSESFVTPPELAAFGLAVGQSLDRKVGAEGSVDPREALIFKDHRYQPQMIDWVAGEIAALVYDRGVSPKEIVVISPYLSDALRFSLMTRLEEHNVPARSHRPSRPLSDEPATRCLLTLAQIAHPQWELRPTPFDVAYALLTAIDGLDLVRAQLLAQIVYRAQAGMPVLSSFEQIRADKQSRITYLLGERYETLRRWLEDYRQEEPAALDHFLSRLFGEALSQPGFAFHRNYDAAEVAANLIDSAQKFRWMIEETGTETQGQSIAQEYVRMVQAGIIADQYIASWELDKVEDAVLVAPAYTFLMGNRPVDYQFWLNVGSAGWHERLYQPLTHPYVLSRYWIPGAKWTDADEHEIRQEALYRLALGLVRRCRKQIYLGVSELGEQGMEQRGPLVLAINRMLRRLAAS